MNMESRTVIAIGNLSKAVIIPSRWTKEMNIHLGDTMELERFGDVIQLRKRRLDNDLHK